MGTPLIALLPITLRTRYPASWSRLQQRHALDTWARVVDADRGTWLRRLVTDDDGTWQDPWLRACALYALPSSLPAEALGLAAPWRDDPDPVVAETARWAGATG